MTGQITVKQHRRRRSGRYARLSVALGGEPQIHVAPFKRRRPAAAIPMWRHDDGTFCGDLAQDEGIVLTNMRCPHGRKVERA